jgi:riboflavin synthase
MFSGIVEESGRIGSIRRTKSGIRMMVQARRVGTGVKIGDSIAVNGCCLTLVRVGRTKAGRTLQFDLLEETWRKTSFDQVSVGGRVNLELALRLGDRLGGHFVTGHVDGTGEITRWEAVGADWVLEVQPPAEMMRHFLYKGSVAIDGISLTVADVLRDRIRMWIIPHTRQITQLGERRVGDRVNLEAGLVRTAGLEPARLTALPPQSSASANSATCANRPEDLCVDGSVSCKLVFGTENEHRHRAAIAVARRAGRGRESRAGRSARFLAQTASMHPHSSTLRRFRNSRRSFLGLMDRLVFLDRLDCRSGSACQRTLRGDARASFSHGAPPPADASCSVRWEGSLRLAGAGRQGAGMEGGERLCRGARPGASPRKRSSVTSNCTWSGRRPSVVSGKDQGRGNSGVYFQGRYEIQVLDSYENPTYPDGQAGAFYGQCRAVGERLAEAGRMADLRHHLPRAEEGCGRQGDPRVVHRDSTMAVAGAGPRSHQGRRDHRGTRVGCGAEGPAAPPGSRQPGALPEHLGAPAQLMANRWASWSAAENPPLYGR